MKKRSLSIPVVVLIAVVALVLGTFGSATAAGITKGQVKKIATKVINKKASGLTVAKAATADTATLAATATNATNAATAANAATVGGFAPNNLARATGASVTTNLGAFDPGTFTDVLSKNVSAPSAGILVVTAGYAFNRLSGNMNEALTNARIALDGTAASAPMAASDNHAGGINASSTVSATIPVTAGTHLVSLQVGESTTGGVFVGGRNLSVVFVPFGNAGSIGALGLQDGPKN